MRKRVAQSPLRAKKVLLIGDSILDVYIYGDIVTQALYAPIPELEERKTAISFGGNGLVASHLLRLGGKVFFISVIGKDAQAKRYRSFKHPNLRKFLIEDPSRRTTVKRRWYAGGKAHLQANEVDNHDLAPRLERIVVRTIKALMPKVDAVVIMDPQHGMLTASLIRAILALSKRQAKPLIVDAQISHRPSNHHLYRGADTMLLNQKEARAVYPAFSEKDPEPALRAIQKRLALTNVVVKLGKGGSAALLGKTLLRTRAPKVVSVDPCGAGDAFLAAFALGDMRTPAETLQLANAWAALSTTVHGTIPPKRKDLQSWIANKK